MDESELAVKDRKGRDIYLDIELSRMQFDNTIAAHVDESIVSAREAMEKAGIGPHDVERIVFVGGPTQYKPLRDKVALALAVASSTDVKPMTAVAEGAAVFAESIDWSSQSRGRKQSRGSVALGGKLDIGLNFLARTPDIKTRVVLKIAGKVLTGSEVQIDSLDTGWSSGRITLQDGSAFIVPLSKPGENTFKIFVFDTVGGSVTLATDRFVITRTAASIDAIPASHSIGIEVRTRAGGSLTLDYLVKEGDLLPKKGSCHFKSETSLKSQSPGSIRFKIWEGDIADPVTDNRFIGMFEIRGRDFDEGVISAGDSLVCEYEVLDSGNIVLEVSIPSIGASFPTRNFYSRQEGLRDLTHAAKLVEEEVERLTERVEETASQITDERLDQARARLNRAAAARTDSNNPESAGEALQDVDEAKKLLAQARKDNLRVIRKADLDRASSFFDEHVKKFARPTELTAFDNLVTTAKRSIDSNGQDFDGHLSELRGRNFSILWRQDWFVIDRFNWLSEHGHLFLNAAEHATLTDMGQVALKANDIDKLRSVVAQLDARRVGAAGADEILAASNIIRA